MKKIQSAFQILLGMLRKKRQEPEQAKEKEAFNEGTKTRSYGLNRRLIYTIVGMIVIAFISGFYFSLDSIGKKTTAKSQFEAAEKKVQPDLPDDYETMNRLASYEGKKGKEAKPEPETAKPQEKASRKQIADPRQEAANVLGAMQEAAALRQKAPFYSPVLPPADLLPKAKEAIQQTVEEKKLKSAIRFTLPGTSEAEETKARTTSPVKAQRPASGYTLLAGSVIPAILQTGINSDLKGQVVAQVQENVFDSITGEALLIPSGSRLIGSYDGEVESGQSRLNVVWNRLIYPDGSSYDLGQMVAISGAGYVGLKDQVDKHSEQVLGAAAFTSALGALASVAAGNTKEDYYSTGQLAAGGAAGNLLNAAASLIEKNINQTPTITIRPGFRFHVFVNEDMNLTPWEEAL